MKKQRKITPKEKVLFVMFVGMVLFFASGLAMEARAYIINEINLPPQIIQIMHTLQQNLQQNNLSTLPIGSITELHLWGYINGQPEYDMNMNYTYIATTPQEQELGFMNQTSYGYGNMLFLFNNDTSHCFWDKNTGTNLTLYWIDWNAESSGSFNTKLGTIKAITQLTAYNTTPECVISDAVMESTSPQVLYANDYISVIYSG